MTLTLDNVEVKVAPGEAQTSFDQAYRSKSYQDRVRKTLAWRQVGGEWRIVREERLIEQVPAKAEALVKRLQELRAEFPQLVSNVRGIGLYQGFSLATPALKSALVARALEQEKLLLLGAGRVSVRFRPNLHVTLQDIDLLAAMLRRLVGGLAREHAGA